MCLQDHDHGDRLKLIDIQKLVDNNPNMQNLSKAKQKEYIDDLQVHHDTKIVGARSSNNAAVVDCWACIIKVSTEVHTRLNHILVELKLPQLRNLLEQTGVCALTFFMHSHIHNSTVPSWVDSDDAIAFVSGVLDLKPMDFLTKFEQWACAMTKGMCCALNIVRTVH